KSSGCSHQAPRAIALLPCKRPDGHETAARRCNETSVSSYRSPEGHFQKKETAQQQRRPAPSKSGTRYFCSSTPTGDSHHSSSVAPRGESIALALNRSPSS